MTHENDIVLIYFEDKPFVFARIEDIAADSKKDWYHVKLLMLQIPLQTVTWILRDIYIDGEEFTMNGKKMRMEKVVCPEDQMESGHEEEVREEPETPENGKVISFAKKRKD
ncbi:MAG: hypothetical protein JRG68_08335 [Deltaproteobacteria bacterium]|nr:hypothetical protein [Deltaproteobacteria bacterium]MBW1940542.1 hypothetical protein [Deltaproteobacteria bacterium]MBW2011418.1 hypothetical protein [Deltaproteobacteria bacterium]MBW2100741.1 hypothetical protein [Deltaproteobacteria bacterium]